MQKFDLRFDANVYALDSHCGQLAKIAVDPESWQITDLIVEDGLIFKRTAVIPMSTVSDTFAPNIHLNIDKEQLKEFPEFQEAVIEKGVPSWRATKTNDEVVYMGLPSANIPNLITVQEKTRIGVNSNAVVLDNNIEVNHLNGRLGHLSHIIVGSEDLLPSELVFSQGMLLPTHRTIPICYVERLSEAGIQLTLTKDEAEDLPEYSPAIPTK